MATTPEKKVKDKVRKILAAAGAYVATPATHGYGSSGVPDIVGCYRGRFFAIECKAGSNKPTALQMKNLSAIASSGGYTEVINETNIEAAELMIIRIDKECQRQSP